MKYNLYQNPFKNIQLLRAGAAYVCSDYEPASSIEQRLMEALAQSNLTLADIGTTATELQKLVRQNALKKAASHLAQAEIGFSDGLWHLEQVSKLCSVYELPYRAVGTNKRLIERLNNHLMRIELRRQLPRECLKLMGKLNIKLPIQLKWIVPPQYALRPETLSTYGPQRKDFQTAVGYLVEARFGFAADLENLEKAETIRTKLNLDYAALGTSQAEMLALKKKLQLAKANILLTELRMTAYLYSYMEHPSKNLLSFLDVSGLTLEEIGSSAEELAILEREYFILEGIRQLARLKAFVDWYAKPPIEQDQTPDSKPYGHIVTALREFESTRDKLGLGYEPFGMTKEAYLTMAKPAAIEAACLIIRSLRYELRLKYRQLSQKDIRLNIKRLERLMKYYDFTLNACDFNAKKMAALKEALGVT